MFMMRFDMRVPGKTPAEIADEYQAAIEMAHWADDKGCAGIAVSEHHAAEDGYMPSPLVPLATGVPERMQSIDQSQPAFAPVVGPSEPV